MYIFYHTFYHNARNIFWRSMIQWVGTRVKNNKIFQSCLQVIDFNIVLPPTLAFDLRCLPCRSSQCWKHHFLMQLFLFPNCYGLLSFPFGSRFFIVLSFSYFSDHIGFLALLSKDTKCFFKRHCSTFDTRHYGKSTPVFSCSTLLNECLQEFSLPVRRCLRQEYDYSISSSIEVVRPTSVYSSFSMNSPISCISCSVSIPACAHIVLDIVPT